MKTIFLFLLFCVTASVAQQSFSIEWENITNNLEGTLTTCMIEGNNGAIIIGTPFGCYRSTDKGITWGKINKGLTDKDVRALTRSATGVLFAGTVRGVFRSLDNGDTWTDVTGNIPPFDAQFFYSHPLGTVYVGVTGHIYYTNDSGATWTEFAKEITNVDRTQYIASVAYGKNNRIFVCFPPYVFKLDPGKNWVKIDENSTGVLYADSTGLMINVRRGFLRMSNTNGDFIYSKSISSYNQYSGLDRIQLLIEIGQTLYPKYYLNNAVIIGGVVIMPKQNVWMNILYSGIDSTCTSCIGGNLQPGRNLPNKLITTMLKHSDGSIYVGTYGSIYKTTDTGNSWTKSSKGLKDPTVFTMFHDNIHSLLFLCTGDGVSKSTDNGLTWVESNTGLKNLLIYSFDVSTKGEIFASSIDGVYTSNDSGKSWFMKNDTFLKDLTIGVVKCLPDGKLFAGSTEESLFMSPDFGKSWGYLGDKIGNIVTCDLLYDRLNNYLYTAFESNIFVSTDKGISFSDGRYGFTRKLRMPQFCRDSENVVYLVEDNLYVQKNLTSNWEMQIFNYTDIGHSYDHWTSCANYTGDVFWGGEGMVKMYDKFANDWFKPSKSLPKSVSPMVTLDTSGYLYTGTIGYGIWRSKKTTTYMVSAQQTKPTDNTIDIPKSSVK
ncbi:MAG: hypothetical protein JNJ85_05800, partial [Candidatus Kapabacteria bacterium]|nr:hypothetical protein [Candidatus Kapabacteria bacterium]